MTLQTDDDIRTYANPAGTAFNGPPAFVASTLFLYVVESDGVTRTLIPSSDYTVSQLGRNLGTRIVLDAPIVSPAGKTLLIQRVVPYSQLTDITNQGDFNAQVLEGGLDTLGMQTQQLARQIGLALRFPSNVITELDPVIPMPAEPGWLLRVRADGLGLDLVQPPAIATLADDTVTDPKVRDDAAIQGTKIDFLQAGTGARHRPQQEKSREVVSVQDWPNGMPGWDGAFYNDVAAALQAAHDSLPSSGGTIKIPSGTYSVSETIRLTKPVTISGDGAANTYIFMRNGRNRDMFVMGDGVISNIEEIIIERLNLHGNMANNTSGSAILMKGVGKPIIRDCYIQQWATNGIYALPSDGIMVGNAVGPDIYDNWINGCKQYGILLTSTCYGGNIHDNMIRVCGQGVNGAGVLYDGTTEHICNNNLFDENEFGIKLQNCQKIQITSNFINNTKQIGIYDIGVGGGTNKGYTITGNHIKGSSWGNPNTYPAIDITGTNSCVTGNAITSGTGASIPLTWGNSIGIKESAGANFNVICGNTIEGATTAVSQVGASSVFMANTTRTTVVNNIMPGGVWARNVANNADLSLIAREPAGDMIDIGLNNPNGNCVRMRIGGAQRLLIVDGPDTAGAGFRRVMTAN